MDNALRKVIDRLEAERRLDLADYAALIRGRTPEAAAYLAERADLVRRRVYGTEVYVRGLIEVSSFCRNDCYYCGLRRSNRRCERYRLTPAQILDCCREGYRLGFRTFVLQGGEDAAFSGAAVASLVRGIKQEFPDCAVTLSLGEYEKADYTQMREAGADRYLLRHETASPAHYARLHPAQMSHAHRLQCLDTLKALGFQAGCGFMVGAPYQTPEDLALDLQFVEKFGPAMCGIGPFLPQKDTPFGSMPGGTAELTVYLLSILRLIRPQLLLPATTALGTVCPGGRELGLRAGANVLMPNLSPVSVRGKYALYDNKLSTGVESAQELERLRQQIRAIGYEIVTSRGDMREETGASGAAAECRSVPLKNHLTGK
jgi:biotin synthase